MLSREELFLLNEILKDLELKDEKEILQKKISLICDQLVIMQKAQEDAAKIQDEIEKLKGDNNEENK